MRLYQEPMEIISNLQIIEDADQKIYMTFWSLNGRKITINFALLVLIVVAEGCLIVINSQPRAQHNTLPVVFMLFCMLILLVLVFFYPSFHAFKMIKEMENDDTDISLLPIFDNGYTIGVRNEKSKLFFTTPSINATIQDLPVIIYYQGTKAKGGGLNAVHIHFWPLMKEGSKRIYSDYMLYKPGRARRKNEDIKPAVLSFIEEIKKKGFTSGAGRPISSKHVDTYDV